MTGRTGARTAGLVILLFVWHLLAMNALFDMGGVEGHYLFASAFQTPEAWIGGVGVVWAAYLSTATGAMVIMGARTASDAALWSGCWAVAMVGIGQGVPPRHPGAALLLAGIWGVLMAIIGPALRSCAQVLGTGTRAALAALPGSLSLVAIAAHPRARQEYILLLYALPALNLALVGVLGWTVQAWLARRLTMK